MVQITLSRIAALALTLSSLASGSLLLDYNATRGDEPSILGQLNLETTQHHYQKENSADLYIKKGEDWRDVPAAHFHRKAGDRRAEYHSLNGKTQEGKTYYIGYSFALGSVPPDGLTVWQWKEYGDVDPLASIPLILAIKSDGLLHLLYEATEAQGSKSQWSKAIEAKKVYTVGLEIYADSDADEGYAQLWWNGRPATFATQDSTKLQAKTWGTRTEPKFGAYGGETEIDTYVYQVQISNSKEDLDAYFFEE